MNSRRLGLTILFTCLALVALSTPAAADETLEGSTINVSAQQEATNLENLEAVADQAGLTAPTNAMLFFDDSGQAYLVGTDQQTRTARATITGEVLAESGENTTGIIIATDVEYDTSGTPVSLSELNDNPSAYENQYIAVEGAVRQAAVLQDPAENRFISQSRTLTLGPKPPLSPDLLPLGRTARNLVKDVSQNGSSAIDDAVFKLRADTLGLSQQSRAWTGRGNATVHGVVQPSGSGYSLYVGRVEFESTEVDSLNAVDDHQGDVVTVDSAAVGVRISAQESLLEAAQCAPTSVAFPPPVNCIPVPADTTISTGVAIDDSGSTTITYVGQSNYDQSQPVMPETGRYELTGRVVNASQVDPRLSGSVLVILDREHISSSVGSDLRQTAQSDVDTVEQYLTEQITSNSSQWETIKDRAQSSEAEVAPETIDTPTATPAEDGDEQESDDSPSVESYSIVPERPVVGEQMGVRFVVREPESRSHDVEVSVGPRSQTDELSFFLNDKLEPIYYFTFNEPGEYQIRFDGQVQGTVEIYRATPTSSQSDGNETVWVGLSLVAGLCIFISTMGLLNRSLSIYDDFSNTTIIGCLAVVAVIGTLAVLFGKDEPTGILVLITGAAMGATTLSIPVFMIGALWKQFIE